MQEMEKQFHIQCVPGDVGRYVLLPGDPGRCEAIAAHFEDGRLIARNREFCVYTGTLLGVRSASAPPALAARPQPLL